tara:strand:- start:74 stop:373 length:300 start_codon:yes stop_codon:yes gene_type:complete
MGTSIHKANYSKESPMKFFGRRKAAPAGIQDPKQGVGMDQVSMEGGVDPETSSAGGGGGARGIAKALLNPAGAIANKMGMGDTTLGKVLNPLGGLFGRK